MKKHLILVLTVIMILTTVPFSAFGAEKTEAIKVNLNGTAIVFSDAQPFVNADGRTMVPLSPVAAAIGLVVVWDDALQVASFTKEYTKDTTPMIQGAEKDAFFMGRETLSFTIGKKEAVYTATFYAVSDTEKKTPLETAYTKTIAMDTTAIVQDQRTYAPVKYLAETLGCDVAWLDGANGGTVDLFFLNEEGVTFARSMRNSLDVVPLAFLQGRAYPVAAQINTGSAITKIEIKEAKIDGKAVKVNEFTEADGNIIVDLQKSPKYLGGANISGPFEFEKKYDIALTLLYTYADGTSKSVSSTFHYAPVELGGKS